MDMFAQKWSINQLFLGFIVVYVSLTCFQGGHADLQNETGILLDIKNYWGNPKELANWTTSITTCSWAFVTCDQDKTMIESLDIFGDVNDYQPPTRTMPDNLKKLINLKILGIEQWGLFGAIPTWINSFASLQELHLRGNHLGGSIPQALWSLTTLTMIDLSSNQLNGSIPKSIGGLIQLQHLDISSNQFEGHIPESLGDLLQLQHIRFGGNYLNGSIPTSMKKLTNLTIWDVNDNWLEGNIPEYIGGLLNLQVLQLGGNFFNGSIPSSLGNLINLISLDVYSNHLSGNIPESIGGLLNLQLLHASGNTLSGSIPSSLGNLTNLIQVDVDSNLLVGNIPESLGGLLQLQYLYLHVNKLNGSIPHVLGNLTKLTHLDFSNNQLVGNIPESLGALWQLQTFYIGTNQLTGNIPLSLGNLSNLINMALDNNPFNTMFPESFGNLKFEYLNMSSCMLSGEIPHSIWNNTNLLSVDLRQNELEGSLPYNAIGYTNVHIMWLEHNNLIGILPDLGKIGLNSTIANITIHLGDNMFNGTISSNIGLLGNLLGYLSLRGNKISGNIPESLANCTSLIFLDLNNNEIHGFLPMALQYIATPSLRVFTVASNRLEGSFPTWITQAPSLQILDLSNNNFQGILPTDFSSMRGYINITASDSSPSNTLYLESVTLSRFPITYILITRISFDISHNNFSGNIPKQLGDLKGLLYLNMSRNTFMGNIPESFGLLRSLEFLDLSNNLLSGSIPQDFSSLASLAYLNVSLNNLSGPIPSGGQFSTFTNISLFRPGNDGLCGFPLNECISPTLAPSPSPTSIHMRRVTHNYWWISLLVIGFAILCIIIIFIYKNAGGMNYDDDIEVHFDKGIALSHAELEALIERRGNKIGGGAKSSVYKGVTNEGRMIAIKILDLPRNGEEGREERKVALELSREVKTLSKLRHRRIIKVLGFFSSREKTALIMDFMPMISLQKQLYEVHECELTWENRLNIAIGIAQGLVYIHNEFHEPIIHRDLKPANILLDADMEPKLGDFGISKFANPNRDGEATMSDMCGTIGYIPPEYATAMRVSTKGDVYSYGIILLELLTRKRPIDEEIFGSHGDLVNWALESFNESPLSMIDPMLINNDTNENEKEQMKLLIKVALLCTNNAPGKRPEVTSIIAMLMQIKERGSDPPKYRSVEDLIEEMTVWSMEDPRSLRSKSFS